METSTNSTEQVFFNDGYDYQGEVIGADEEAPTVISPLSKFKTIFYVTPASINGQRTGNANTRVQLRYKESTGEFYGGIYDNDENPIDFYLLRDVVCTGALKLEDLVTSPVIDMLLATNKSGWAYIRTLPGEIDQDPLDGVADNPTDQAIVGKLEIKTPGRARGKRFSDFRWVRSSDSVLDSCHPPADLIVENIEVVWDYPVDIDLVVTIKNQGGSTSYSINTEGHAHGSLGEFRAIIKWKSGISEEFTNVLCEETIPALAANETYEFSCHDVLPQAFVRIYLVVADNLNWIDESNEGNNTASEGVVNP
jgi:hypothetical protein